MSCTDFLGRVPQPSESQVREMLSGHLCRCTGYTNIVNAILEAAAIPEAAPASEAEVAARSEIAANPEVIAQQSDTRSDV